MERVAGTGYLARVEANKVGVRAGPDVVYIRLFRDFAEEGQQTTMFAELAPGDAMAVIRELQAAVKVALATITPV
jgi:hypothetical protein